ncbi:hypothetical protein FMM05_20805 [Flavobacterium zepuense]|uniref:Uncharacterized protein n=1 Tax=Flavobacterium zepuense TaxID=2593302 RepID=A0A552US35_9FLAO|nr:hypothetical protein [Flavobacterium zepuense]TRW21033.1 hypothetical protein FMM05_20805 [Flavobacterium zepuense]
MKKILNTTLYIVLFYCITGCSNTNSVAKEKVTIRITSPEINSLKRDDLNSRLGYNNELEKLKARNVLNCVIKNNSDEKLLFIFDPIRFPAGALESCVTDKNNIEKKLKKINNILGGEGESSLQILKLKRELVKYRDDQYEGMDIPNINFYDDYHKNSFVLMPGEEKVFKLKIYLPILTHNPANFDELPFSYYNNLSNSDRFSLIYRLDPTIYEKSLPKWELEALKRNGIKFYKDSIKSNSIPINLLN